MGAFSGALNFRRSFVRGRPPTWIKERALKSISPRRFRPLGRDDARAHGWVSIIDSLADELHGQDVFFDDWVALGFRWEERQVSGRDLRVEVAHRLRALKRENKRVSPEQRKALKEAVHAELLVKTPPARKIAELLYSPERAEARVFGATLKMAEAMAELFERTFELKMLEANPGELVRRFDLGELIVRSKSTPRLEAAL